VVFDNALWRDRVADPSARDPQTVAVRDLGRAIRDREDLVPVLLPVSDGLLAAAHPSRPGLPPAPLSPQPRRRS
jgi:predicted O-methyltransferase YrrM